MYMTFKSLPLMPREIRATEAVLERVYEAAKLGLKGNAMALHAGILPVELARLRQFDEVVDMAIMKGHADNEALMAKTLMDAALAGDAKVALEVLKHRHDWQAAQRVEVVGSQQISITMALANAEKRIGEIDHAATNLLPSGRADVDDAVMVAPDKGRSRGVRIDGLPVGGDGHAA